MRRMEVEPRLGTCSGKPCFPAADGRLVGELVGDEMSVGMTKFYRTECFLEIGGFVPHVMWDGIDCHRCRMLGWSARSFDVPDLRFLHLRAMGSSQGGLWTGRWRHGTGQWFMGTGLLYMTASALRRSARPPIVTGGLAMWLGYVASLLARKPRYPDPEFRALLRRYQRECLLLGKRRATQRLETGRSVPARDEGPLTTRPSPGRAEDFPPEVELEGVRLHAIDEGQCVKLVLDAFSAGRGGWIVTPNLDQLRRMRRDQSLRERYARAELALADGMPLVWACSLQRTPLPGRVAGSDLIWSLSRAAAERGLSLFLLGGDAGTAEEAGFELASRFQGLRVAGTMCPEPGFEERPGSVEEIAARLAAARPDIVFVALGVPRQEVLIERLRPGLPSTWWMGVGISFSFVAGRVKRAPPWVRRVGLEWAHRLAQEPRRLAGRYLVDGLPFAAGLMARSTVRGMRSRAVDRVR